MDSPMSEAHSSPPQSPLFFFRQADMEWGMGECKSVTHLPEMEVEDVNP